MKRRFHRQAPFLRETQFARGDTVEILQGKLKGLTTTVTRCHEESVTVLNPSPNLEARNMHLTLPLHAVRAVKL